MPAPFSFSRPPILALRVIALIVLFPLAASVASAITAHNPVGTLKTAASLMVVLYVAIPGAISRYVLEPLGLYRFVWLQARWLQPYNTWGDREGGALTAAARALMWRPNTKGEAWLRARLAQERNLDSCGLTAAGVHARLCGQNERSDRLFYAVDILPARAWDGHARWAARRWRLADAASRGDWNRALSLANRTGPGGILLRAARGSGTERQSRLLAVFAWIFLGCSPRWLFLVREALTRPRLEPPRAPPSLIRTDDPVEPITLALSLQQRALQNPNLTLDELTELGQAWEQVARDPAVLAHLARRALALNLPDDPSTFRDRLVDDAIMELAAHLRQHPQPPVSVPGTMPARVYEALQEWHLRDLELQCRDLKRRASTETFLPSADEWDSFMRIRDRWIACFRLMDTAAGTPHFIRLWQDPCNYGVAMYNRAGEKRLGHVLFLWLLEEARRYSHQAAITLLEKNARGSKPPGRFRR